MSYRSMICEVVDGKGQFVEVEQDSIDDILLHVQNEVSGCTVCLTQKEAKRLCKTLFDAVVGVDFDET